MLQELSFIVTGANSYLGRAFANFLSKTTQHRVLLTSRSAYDFDSILSDQVIYMPGLDLTQESCVDLLLKSASAHFPGEFHIINCLGHFPGYQTIENISIADAKKVFDGNILTLYAVANRFLPLMRERGGGHFVGFSAHTNYQHYPLMTAFSAAKVAVEALIKGIANEYLEFGISANTVALSTLLTQTEQEIKPFGDFKNWLNTEEVCDAVLNLITQKNKLINGNVIHLYKHSNSYFHQSYFERIKNK